MKQEQSIQTIFEGQSKRSIDEYRLRLNASVDCIRFLLRQGLSFRGHDETKYSKNRGNFLELLRFLADHNVEIGGVVLQNAPNNMKLVAPDIQKDIVHAAAVETTNKIIEELGDESFSVLVDESRDVSYKEQMIVLLRFVSNQGSIIERLLGIVHVADTTAISLKASLQELFSKHGLSFSRLRGQGYDGASNMRGEFNGLKALILKENSSAYYVHCFAHQLQLVLVAVATNHQRVAHLFNWISSVQNTVGASCKRRDKLREKQAAKIKEALEDGDILTGRGLNQETGLARSGDTRWSSHYKSVVNLLLMFDSILEVLKDVVEKGEDWKQKANASNLIEALTTFDFIFSCFFMRKVLGITNELSQALQRKEQDIMNAVSLVIIAKFHLQDLRDNGWDSLLDEAQSFCSIFKIDVLNMEDMWVAKRSQRRGEGMTNQHFYCVEFFYVVIDMILQELNNRFTEGNTELLRCMSCLNPSNNFHAFDKMKLIDLANFYPNDFSERELCVLESQLECYILDVQSDGEFSQLNGIGDLAEKLVVKRKNLLYPIVYKLVKLVLILPVATASVERAFSAMTIVKTRLRNRMGDEWMNDNLVTYIEKDIFSCVTNEAIMQRFQNMKTRRGLLFLLE